MLKTAINLNKMKKHLSFRYIIALSLIAFNITFAHTLISIQLHDSDRHARYINQSGMQRMLSQRIALFSNQVSKDNSHSTNVKLIANMKAAIQKMEANHKDLTSIDFENLTHGAILKDIYFGYMSLNNKTHSYLTLSKDFTSTYTGKNANWKKLSNLRHEISSIASGKLLDELDTAVGAFELSASATVDEFKHIETYTYYIGLIILLLEVLFIFRPMIENIVIATRSLDERNRELVEFNYRISHDLRSPVVSSLGLARLAIEAIESNDLNDAQTSVQHIEKSMEGLDKLIGDILLLSKVKTTDSPIQEFTCEEVIGETLEKMKYLENYSFINFSTNIEIPHSIKMRRFLLQQILENLISNAIKYADPSEKFPTIYITAVEKPEHYIFRVEDNGIGIPEMYRDKVFDIFQRFHPKIGSGSGLGLYIVKQQANILKADIKYIPLKKGSCFELSIPKYMVRKIKLS